MSTLARSARLSAAVAVGAGLILASAPAASATSGIENTAHYTGTTGGVARFHTYHEVQSRDLRVTVAPAESETSDDSGTTSFPATGPALDVPFTYDDELERGTVDIAQARRLLGEDGMILVTVDVTGGEHTPDMTIAYGPDADLSDSAPGDVLGGIGPMEYEFTRMPEIDRRTLLAAPGSRMVYLQGNTTGGAPGPATMTVTEGPRHGVLVQVPELRDGNMVLEYASTVYVAEEGFTGADSAVFTLTGENGVVRTLEVTYLVGDPRADDVPLDEYTGGLPYDESQVWAALKAQDAGDDAPADDDTRSDAPAADDDDTAAPAADDADKSDTADTSDKSDTGKHSVPDKVETGQGQAWWLAGLGALGAGALVALRPRRRAS